MESIHDENCQTRQTVSTFDDEPRKCSCGLDDKIVSAMLSRLPSASGDGYGYGGGYILSVNGVSFMVGESHEHRKAAHTILGALSRVAEIQGRESELFVPSPASTALSL